MSTEEDTSGGDGTRCEAMSGTKSRPLLIPKLFMGTGSFSDWVDHFESVAVINEWDDGAKLLWMRVQLVGTVQTAYGRLPTTAKYTWYLT